MSILGNLIERRSVGGGLEDPLVPLTASTLMSVMSGPKTKSGIVVHEESAVGRFIAVYRACALVAGTIASLELRAFREGPGREPFESQLLQEPHPDMTRVELMETLIFHELLWGNSYSSKVRDRGGMVRELWPISPRRFEVTRIAPTAANRWGKELHLFADDGTSKMHTPEDILHIPGPSFNGLTGLSPIGVARQAIGMGLAAEEYGARLFGSGTLMSGYLSTDQPIGDQAQAEAIKQRWKERIGGGLGHAHEVAVLDRGMKFVPISMSPEDAQFIESRKFQKREIATLYGIPPYLLGDVETSSSWGTGIEQQSIGFIVYTLRPWLSRIEQRISKECLPVGVRAEFNVDGLLRGDAQARAAAAAIWLDKGIKRRNEVRVEEGLPPDPDADGFFGATTPAVPTGPLPDNVIAINAARALLAIIDKRSEELA